MLHIRKTPPSAVSPYALEILPGPLPDGALFSSVRSSLDGFASLGRQIVLTRTLANRDGRLHLSQTVAAETSADLGMAVRFLTKLYGGRIAFRRPAAPSAAAGFRPSLFGSVSLVKHHCFQVKKPGELGTDTFTHSSSVVAGILLECGKAVLPGQTLTASCSFIGAGRSKIAKHILYAVRAATLSAEKSEELDKSFSDRFPFFGFRFQIATDADGETVKSVVEKNLSSFSSPWNAYVADWATDDFQRRETWFRKCQSDQLLAHGLALPIFEASLTPAAPRLFPAGEAVRANGSLVLVQSSEQGSGSHEQSPFLGKAFLSNILEDRAPFRLEAAKLKNGHGVVLGGTGSGKSYSTSWHIAFQAIASITAAEGKPRGDDYLVVDPHGSLVPNILATLGKFHAKRQASRAGREWAARIYRPAAAAPAGAPAAASSPWLLRADLRFNPLLSAYLPNEKDFSAEFSRHAQAVLDGLKGIWDEQSFGPRNEESINAGIRLFLLLNTKKPTHPYALPDLLPFFQGLRQSGKIPDKERVGLAALLSDPLLRPEIRKETETVRGILSGIVSALAENGSLLDSTLNKLGMFQGSLADVFGQGRPAADCPLGLRPLFLSQHEDARLHLFDLSELGYEEKGVVASFLLSYSYHYGTKKPKTQNTPAHNLYIDEFSSLAQGENLLLQLARAMPEMRKYKVNYCVFLQEVSQAGFAQVYPHCGYILAFSVDAKQRQMISEDFATGRPGEPPTIPADLANLERGRMCCFLKYASGGNALLTLEGFGPKDIPGLLVAPPAEFIR